jgi:hypothetical protein
MILKIRVYKFSKIIRRIPPPINKGTIPPTDADI